MKTENGQSVAGRRVDTIGAHTVDLFPGDDDVATRAEYKRRVAAWEAEDPARFAAWKAEQERERKAMQEVSRELSKLMRSYL